MASLFQLLIRRLTNECYQWYMAVKCRKITAQLIIHLYLNKKTLKIICRCIPYSLATSEVSDWVNEDCLFSAAFVTLWQSHHKRTLQVGIMPYSFRITSTVIYNAEYHMHTALHTLFFWTFRITVLSSVMWWMFRCNICMQRLCL